MIKTTIIYAVSFAISLIFCRIYEQTNEKNDKFKNILLILAILLPPIVLATLRYNVGTDYQAYVINYVNINWGFDYSIIWKFYSKEPLYVIINILGYWLTGTKDGLGMFFIASCIYMFFIFKGISYFKNKISMTLALFIFYLTYYLVFFNALRQMIAVAILFFAFRYIFERKPIKYVFWVVIAGLFHKTAYVMIILYLLSFKIESKKINKIFYTLILISPIFMIPIQKIIVYLSNKFMIYENYANMPVDFDLKFLLYLLPILVLVTIKRKKILKIDIRYEILIRILFLQLPFQFLGCYINIADRMAMYSAIFQAILIPIILMTDMSVEKEVNFIKNNQFFKRMSEKSVKSVSQGISTCQKILNNKTNLKVAIISWYILYFIMMYIVLEGQGVYPYQSIFSNLT